MSKFKVGDRVLVKDGFDFGQNASLGCKLFCMLPHTIESIENNMAFLTTIGDFAGSHRPVMAYIPLESLIPCDAPIEPTDSKTAFLAELKELLVRHNAAMFPYDMHKCLIKLGEDFYDFTKEITAENIMGYDKEEV